MLALLAAAALAGCGVGAGESPDGVRLTVTDRFGTQTVIERTAPEVGGEDTVMRLLQRNARVSTRYGGGFVQAIEGRAGDEHVDWFYFVNGIQPAEGARGEATFRATRRGRVRLVATRRGMIRSFSSVVTVR